nr:type I secretion system permease/ATPase [Nitrospirota bacterium]
MGEDVTPQAPTDSAAIDTGLSCLLIVARFHGVPADGAQLRHQFAQGGAPLGETELLQAAKQLGFRSGVMDSDWSRLAVLPLPAIAVLADGHFVVAAKADAERILIQDPRDPRPLLQTREQFETAWTGRLLFLAKRAALGNKDRHFDFTWFIPAIVKYRALLGEVLLASFFLQGFAVLTPLFTQVLIDKVLIHKGLTTLNVLAVGMLTMAVFDASLGALRTYLFSHTTNRIDVGLAAQLFRHVLTLPLSYFEARRVGDTVARVRELETIRHFLTSTSVTLVIDLFFALVFVGLLLVYSPILTLIVVGSFPLYAGVKLLVTPAVRARLNEKFNRNAENQAFLVETVTGIQTVKAMAVEPAFQRKWEEQVAAYVKASFRAATLVTFGSQASTFIQKVTTITVLWVGAQLVLSGDLSVGQLIAFNMISGLVTSPIMRLSQMWQEFQQVGISVKRLGDVLNAPTEPSYRPGQAALSRIAGAVTFDSVEFRYRADGPEVLHKVSFEVPAGAMVGIVGASGSGKSTITKLVQRLYLPGKGRVLVDAIDLAQVDPAWLRRQIGVVLQENYLFNRTVRENIALADPGFSMDRVMQAAKLAGAHDFIMELPQGYDAVIGEHGSTLSGGQRQRIAIARALITNPRLLIFDEATSALDYESEAIIQQNLAQICKGRTVFMIAHRLNMVQRADVILVIEKGELTEQGTHEHLLRLNGYYARLYRQQRGLYAIA